MRAGAWADERPVRVVIVGAGEWGRRHARVFAGRPEVDLRAVAARHRDRAQARAAEWGIGAYTSVPEMIEAEAPDLVSVCLPNEAHFDATMQVIEAGVPLLAEKPLAFDLGQADQMIAAAADRNLFFAINFNHRYAEPVRRAKAAISGGDLGNVVFGQLAVGGEPGTSRHPDANLDRDSVATGWTCWSTSAARLARSWPR